MSKSLNKQGHDLEHGQKEFASQGPEWPFQAASHLIAGSMKGTPRLVSSICFFFQDDRFHLDMCDRAAANQRCPPLPGKPENQR